MNFKEATQAIGLQSLLTFNFLLTSTCDFKRSVPINIRTSQAESSPFNLDVHIRLIYFIPSYKCLIIHLHNSVQAKYMVLNSYLLLSFLVPGTDWGRVVFQGLVHQILHLHAEIFGRRMKSSPWTTPTLNTQQGAEQPAIPSSFWNFKHENRHFYYLTHHQMSSVSCYHLSGW